MDHNFIPTEYAAQMGAPFKIRQSKLISLQLVIERMKRENPYDKNQETEEEQARPLKKSPKLQAKNLCKNRTRPIVTQRTKVSISTRSWYNSLTITMAEWFDNFYTVKYVKVSAASLLHFIFSVVQYFATRYKISSFFLIIFILAVCRYIQ